MFHRIAKNFQTFDDVLADLVERNRETILSRWHDLVRALHSARDLSIQQEINLQGKPFHVLNLVFDSAIRLAVQTFSINRALGVYRRRKEYLSFVAHDLRNPLNAVALASKVLQGLFQTGPANSAAKIIKVLQRNVQSMSLLVEKVIEENSNLRTESRFKLERHDVDLWPLVESMVYDLNPVAGTGSTRLLNNVPEDMVIYADAGLLR